MASSDGIRRIATLFNVWAVFIRVSPWEFHFVLSWQPHNRGCDTEPAWRFGPVSV